MTDEIPSAHENMTYVLTYSVIRTKVLEASCYPFNRICVAEGTVEISPKEMLMKSKADTW